MRRPLLVAIVAAGTALFLWYLVKEAAEAEEEMRMRGFGD